MNGNRFALLVTALAEAAIVGLASWTMTTADDRRAMRAGAWRAIEHGAMHVATASANVAAFAYARYQETVRV